MLGLGAKLGPNHKRRNRFKPYGPAVIQLDATSEKSAGASVWSDLKGTADFNVTNAALTDGGTKDGYYYLSGTGLFQPASNPDILANLHKTTAGNQWTIVVVGQTTGVDNDWLYESFPSSGGTGFGVKWQGNTNLSYTQYDSGAAISTTPTTLPNNTDFILITSFDYDTLTYRTWVNTYNTTSTVSGAWGANTDSPSGTFALGGLTDGGQYNGRLYGFMVLDEFIDVNGARSIINYYNKVHERTYVEETMYALFTGQSNMNRMFADYTGAGAANFEAVVGAYYNDVQTVNGALNGAALHYDADEGPGAFLNSSNDGKGAVYTGTLEPAVTASGIDSENFDVVFILIGETDAGNIGDATITEAEHKAAYQTFVDLL